MSRRPSEPRSRFYDGALYARVLDPFLRGLHELVADQVEVGARVLDIGSGTGQLARLLAGKAKRVVGIELSPAMVDHARGRLAAEPIDNLSYWVGDATRALAEHPEARFDVATLVLALHEMSMRTRVEVLRAAAGAAEKILCVDFRVPMPRNLAGIRNRIFEVLAGPSHFRAYRDFGRRGGIPGVAEAAGLRCRHLRFVDAATLDVCELRSRGIRRAERFPGQ